MSPLMGFALIVFLGIFGTVFYALWCKGDVRAALKTRFGEFSLEAKEQRERRNKQRM